MSEKVFITGVTGFMGRRLSEELRRRGHAVKGLVRSGSERRAPGGCEAVVGDATRPETYEGAVAGCSVFVQLVGVTHPNPALAEQFSAVDGASGRGAVGVAQRAGVRRFVYVSVAQPAPIMQAYIAVRAAVENEIRRSDLDATILRPWYVLGPGRRWPLVLLPLYWIFECVPASRDSARRLGFVSIDEMVAALVKAVESDAPGVQVWDVPMIKKGGRDE